MNLLKCYLGLIAFDKSVLSWVFVLNDSSPKECTFLMPHSILSLLYTYYHYQSKTQIQQIINRSLPNITKLMNHLNASKYFIVDSLIEYLMTKKLFVIMQLMILSLLTPWFRQHRLIPCHAWTPWYQLHTCYAAGQISPPSSADAHWIICIWQKSTY